MAKRISDDTRAQIIRLLNMGWTNSLIAEELHMRANTVWSIGAAAGIHSKYKGGKVQSDEKKRALTRDKSAEYSKRRLRKRGENYGVYEEIGIDGIENENMRKEDLIRG